MKHQMKRMLPRNWPTWDAEDLLPKDPRQQDITVNYLTASGVSATSSGGTRTRPLYEIEEERSNRWGPP